MISLGGAPGEDLALLLAVASALLLAARLGGAAARRFGVPGFAGELAAGFILGPSVTGIVAWPAGGLFVGESRGGPELVLGLLWLSAVIIVIFQFLDGFGRLPRPLLRTVLLSLAGEVVVSVALAVALLLLLPAQFPRAQEFAICAGFVAAALLVAEVPSTSHLLREQRLSKTDVALVTVAQTSFATVIGWFLLSVMALSYRAPGQPGKIAMSLVASTVLLGGGGILGRRIANRLLAGLEGLAPAVFLPLTVTLVAGCLLSALTQEMVGHALAGAALTGWVVDGLGRFGERDGLVLEGLARGFASPLFFAYLGSRVDLWRCATLPEMAVLLLLLVLGGTVVRIGGAALGAWLGRTAWPDALAVGLASNVGGGAGALAALVAREAGVIGEGVFTGLVLLSIVSSALASPWLRWSLRRRRRIDFSFFHRVVIVGELKGRTRREVLRELVLELGKGPDLGDRELIINALLEREDSMPTGLPNGLAIPHARLAEIDRPFLAIGRSPVGVDFGSSDGLPARLIFLLLTPQRDEGAQLQVLATIAGAMNDPERRTLLLNSKDTNELLMHFEEVLRG